MFVERLRTIFQVLVIVFLAGGISACVPMKETFYKPSADGGETIGRTCHGKAGATNHAVFQHPEARIGVSAFWERPLIEVYISIPDGASLFVPATQFRITTRKSSEWLILSKFSQYQSPSSSRGMPKMTNLPIKKLLVLQGKKLRTFF